MAKTPHNRKNLYKEESLQQMRAEVQELIQTLHEVFKSIHQRSYHKTENKNIYPGQPKILNLIRKQEGLTQKELSKLSFVTPATITGMLIKLETNGYVRRVPDEIDKRIMRVYLTEEGHNLAASGEKHMMCLLENLFDGFDDEELHTFLTLTRKLQQNLYKNDN